MTLIRIRLGDAFYFLIDCFLEGIRSGGGGRFFLFFFFFLGGGGGGGRVNLLKKIQALNVSLAKTYRNLLNIMMQERVSGK